MRIFLEFLKGIVSVLAVTPPPLYRYPYRNSAEAFRGDWKRLGEDVADVMEQEHKHG